MPNALVINRDLDLGGHNILNAANLGGAAPRSSIQLRWPDEEEFETAAPDQMKVIAEDRVNFDDLPGTNINIKIELDLRRDGAEGNQAKVLLALDPTADGSTPPTNFFGGLITTASATWQSLDNAPAFQAVFPKPTGRALVRLVGQGVGRAKNKVVTFTSVPT